MEAAINWTGTSMFLLFIALSATFARRWQLDSKWLSDTAIFGPEMCWYKQQHLMEHLFIISTVFALIIAATIVIKATQNRQDTLNWLCPLKVTPL